MIAGDEYEALDGSRKVRIVKLVGTVGAGVLVCFTDNEALGEVAEEFQDRDTFGRSFHSTKTVPDHAQELFVALHRLNYAGILSDKQSKQLWAKVVREVVEQNGYRVKATGYRTYEVTHAD